jgi:glycosyltransferase involved in cell wall biosynthesis
MGTRPEAFFATLPGADTAAPESSSSVGAAESSSSVGAPEISSSVGAPPAAPGTRRVAVRRLVPVFVEGAARDDATGNGRDAGSARTIHTALVAVPAYNEERFIGSVVHGVRLEGYECLVIDDGSTDRTVEIATAAGATVDRQPGNQGKAAAVARAFRIARRRGLDLVLMDGDWQHDPRDIHDLLEPLRRGDADIVSGSRFMSKGPAHRRRGRIPSLRSLGLRAFTAISNAASGHRVTDSQTGFRAFSKRALTKMEFRSHGFSVEVEVLFLARSLKLRHLEVPISARYEDPPKRNIFGQGARVLDGIIRLVAYYRPLLFFGVPSMVLVVMGLALGLYVISLYQQQGELAAGYALLAVLQIVVGVVGLLAGLLLHVLRGIVVGFDDRLRGIAHILDSQPPRPDES